MMKEMSDVMASQILSVNSALSAVDSSVAELAVCHALEALGLGVSGPRQSPSDPWFCESCGLELGSFGACELHETLCLERAGSSEDEDGDEDEIKPGLTVDEG